jgi:hypothetical protein
MCPITVRKMTAANHVIEPLGTTVLAPSLSDPVVIEN